MKEFTEANFDNEVLAAEGPVLVKFSSPTCRPCALMKSVVNEFMEKYGDKLTVGEVDISENMGLAGNYKIRSVPTIVLFKNGQIEKEYIGYMDMEEMEKIFAVLL